MNVSTEVTKLDKLFQTLRLGKLLVAILYILCLFILHKAVLTLSDHSNGKAINILTIFSISS